MSIKISRIRKKIWFEIWPDLKTIKIPLYSRKQLLIVEVPILNMIPQHPWMFKDAAFHSLKSLFAVWNPKISRH